MSIFVSNLVRTTVLLLLVFVGSVVLLIGCGSQPGQREFDEGLKEMEAGQYARARVQLEASITKRPGSPDNARAYNYLGVVSAKLGQLERAIDEFEESINLNDKLFDPTYNLGLLMHKGGNTENAHALLSKAADLDCKDVSAFMYLAHVATEDGDGAAAQSLLDLAEDRGAPAPVLLTARAKAIRLMEDSEDAVSLLMRALEHNPDYGPALYNLAYLYEHELDDPDKAATFYRRYLEEGDDDARKLNARASFERLYRELVDTPAEALAIPQPEEVPTKESIGPTFEQLLVDAGKAAEAKQPEKALGLSLQAAEIAKQRRDTKGREKALLTAIDLCFEHAEAHVAWGNYCLERARYVPALQSFKRARLLDPKSLAAHLGLAEAATETGEYDAALITLQEARRLAPNDHESLWALATLYDEHLDMTEQAAGSYQEFARRFPNDPRIVRAQERLKVFKVKQEPDPKPPVQPKKPEVAPAPVQEKPVTKKNPPKSKRDVSTAVQAYNRGTTYQQRKDWDRAIYYYTRAIENDRNFSTAYYNLGTVYRASGELDASRDAYVKAVQLQPRMVNARYNLALVYADMKQTSAAIEQLRTVLKIDPRHTGSHYVLGLLYARNPQAENLARQHYEQFLVLAPRDPLAASARAWLASHPARVR